MERSLEDMERSLGDLVQELVAEVLRDKDGIAQMLEDEYDKVPRWKVFKRAYMRKYIKRAKKALEGLDATDSPNPLP